MKPITSVQLRTNTPDIEPDLGDVVRLFLGDVPISAETGETVITHTHTVEGDTWIETLILADEPPEVVAGPVVTGRLEERRQLKRLAKSGLFLLLSRQLDAHPPWGSLTGIRPTRLLYEALAEGLSSEAAERRMTDTFFVTPRKARLLTDIVDMQRGLIESAPDAFDLYIGIPFCTTRCTYCSFSSGEIGRGKLLEPYADALCREMEQAAALMRAKDLHVRAAYMGGGTPTALPCALLDRLLTCAQTYFPNAVEWTVEAGRPDTIDRDKLAMLRAHAITRISVNPQTFSDATLERIGRRHTAADTLNAFALAREAGFDDINMDVIAALPGETMDDFRHTIETVIALEPESVTVHSLAIKRSSRLHERLTIEKDPHNQADAPEAEKMIDFARDRLYERGYRPYYLYRQKYMAGNLENVGYAKPGKACLYNIGNMEEQANVLALGAGAITKWLFPRELRIERAANVKNIEAYIDRVDEMVERKRVLLARA